MSYHDHMESNAVALLPETELSHFQSAKTEAGEPTKALLIEDNPGDARLIQLMLPELMPVAADAGRFLGEMNRSLYTILRRIQEPFPASAFYLVADASAGELKYSSAGHPSPFRVRRTKGQAEQLKSLEARHGPALGLFENPVYPTCRCPMMMSVWSPGALSVSVAPFDPGLTFAPPDTTLAPA